MTWKTGLTEKSFVKSARAPSKKWFVSSTAAEAIIKECQQVNEACEKEAALTLDLPLKTLDCPWVGQVECPPLLVQVANSIYERGKEAISRFFPFTCWSGEVVQVRLARMPLLLEERRRCAWA